MKFWIDDKDVNDDKDDKDKNNVENDNDDNDDEYNDINEHLVKLDSDKPDQSNEVNDNKTDFQGLDHLLKDLFCSTYIFTSAQFCGCINGHNLVNLGLPGSHQGKKNWITQRLHISPLSVRYYLHLTKNETL